MTQCSIAPLACWTKTNRYTIQYGGRNVCPEMQRCSGGALEFLKSVIYRDSIFLAQLDLYEAQNGNGC